MAAKLCQIERRKPEIIAEATVLSMCCALPVVGIPGEDGTIEWRCVCGELVQVEPSRLRRFQTEYRQAGLHDRN